MIGVRPDRASACLCVCVQIDCEQVNERRTWRRGQQLAWTRPCTVQGSGFKSGDLLSDCAEVISFVSLCVCVSVSHSFSLSVLDEESSEEEEEEDEGEHDKEQAL